MSSLNKASIIGNLGRDPEVRHTQSGDTVANLSVATSEKWTDRSSGERRERTEWHRVVVWGKLAEIAEKYLRKGSKVYLEGQIRTRKWQDNDGKDRYTTEIVLSGFNSTLVMLGGNEGGGDRPADQGGAPAQDYNPPQGDDLDDDIPF